MPEALDALLLFPPSLECYPMPEIALPRLLAWLRAHGHSARQVDLNAEYWNRWLFQDEAFLPFLERLARLSRDAPDDAAYRPVRDAVARMSRASPRDINDVKKYVYENRREVFLFVFERTRWRRLDREALDRALASPDPLVARFLDDHLARIAGQVTPRVVGLSVISPQQVPQAVEVARRARALWPEARVVVGGPWAKLGRDLLPDPRYGFLFDWFDVIVTGDGEEPLLDLVGREDGTGLDDVPNLVRRRNGVPVATRPAPALPLAALPDPDFDGIEFGLYTDPFVPVERASLCYWKRCVFCWHNHPDRAGEALPPETVAARVEAHQRATGMKRFSFIDNAVNGPYMRELARAILARNLAIEWVMQARFEEEFLDPEYCRLLAGSGCRMVFFGLETSDPKALRRFRKGIRIEHVPAMMARCHEAGIGVALYLLVYPGQTRRDFEDTLRFCLGLRRYVQVPIVQRFLLNRNCLSYDRPDLLGIRPVTGDGAVWLDFFDLPYQADRGMLDDVFIEEATRRFGRLLRAGGGDSGPG